jgi:murein peptide amidase A
MTKHKGVVLSRCFLSVLLVALLLPPMVFAYNSSSNDFKQYLNLLEKQNNAYGWADINLEEIPWEYYRITKHKHPLMFVHFGNNARNCILFLGGVHGDELPTVYFMFKLAQHVKDNPSLFKDKCIVIAPLINPDGFLSESPTRVNANGVDINRNLPTRDWQAKAIRQWILKTKRNKRYYPGAKPSSEQETLFQVALIKKFKPQKILSAHSPLNFYDYDGPSSDLNSFEHWMEQICKEVDHPLKKFRYYPGSLGNYAGHERNIFTLTLEMPSSDCNRGLEYFQKFQSSILKFIDLPVAGMPPHIKLINKYKTSSDES